MTRLRPIFIGGVPRSGTTLLASRLGLAAGHITTPETPFKYALARLFASPLAAEERKKQALDLILPAMKLWELNLQPGQLGQQLTGAHQVTDILLYLVRQYGRQILGKQEQQIWIDHTPDNLERAGTLLGIFPDARLICMIRDGRGVSASVMPLDWGPNTIHTAASWWLEKLGFGLAAQRYHGHEKVLCVRYEDLLKDPEQVLRDVCTFCAIPFDPVYYESEHVIVPGYTRAQHALLTKPLDPAKAESWKGMLREREIEIFESLTAEMLSYLDYPLLYGIQARPPSRSEIRAMRVKEILRRQRNKSKRNKRLRPYQ